MIAFVLSLTLIFSLWGADKPIENRIFNRSLTRLVRSKTIEDILREEAAMRAAEREEAMPLLPPEEVMTPPQRTRRVAPKAKKLRTSKKRKTVPVRSDAPQEIILGYTSESDSSVE